MQRTAHERVAELLTSGTSFSSRVLVWGSEADVLYLARRESATRYIYILPFYLPGGRARYDELRMTVSASPPDAVVLAPDRPTGAEPVMPDSLCALLMPFHRQTAHRDGFWLLYMRKAGDVSFAEDVRAGRVVCTPDIGLFQ